MVMDCYYWLSLVGTGYCWLLLDIRVYYKLLLVIIGYDWIFLESYW